MIAIGAGIGGGGMRAAIVDLANGELVSEPLRIGTPQPATPAAMQEVVFVDGSHPSRAIDSVGAMSEPLTALFVRVPASLAAELDERSNAQGRSKQAVVTEMLLGRIAARTNDADAILDLEEVASLLSVTPDDVLERVADGGLPGRRFGTVWRFSRAAILGWMSGSDPVIDHPTGF